MGTTMNSTKMNTGAPRTPRRLVNAWPESMPRAARPPLRRRSEPAHIAHDEFPGRTMLSSWPTSASRCSYVPIARGISSKPSFSCRETLIAWLTRGTARDYRGGGSLPTSCRRRAGYCPRRARERVAPGHWSLGRVFGWRGDRGGDVRHRRIEAPTFENIGDNYPFGVRGAL